MQQMYPAFRLRVNLLLLSIQSHAGTRAPALSSAPMRVQPSLNPTLNRFGLWRICACHFYQRRSGEPAPV